MTKNQWISPFLVAAALFAGNAFAHPEAAHVEVDGAWIRATVPGQQGTGGFMRLKAKEALTLVGVRSAAAGVAEVHEMKMDGDVMRMRAISALALPAGQTVELKSGGYHLMLQQLKAPLLKGSEVPVTLEFKDAKGELSRLNLRLPVATSAPAGATPAAGHSHGHAH
ncbi:copper chaperone PCu(A)C [Acidovorax sp. CCYZU-2555]|uniref:copper chaperone PCu(A)C n=1 Tax=Acidovorax sp. CCYZU-2555 TaxID=2835042 RepID=UPI001BCBE300|nr:copper chaperone PCu(A)C [Acidovorax sp. CCYZU-2555]MBS7780212.1 copper chaperone PCu(A)C [Acidovorax sp. CCYZU-2555]